MAVISDRCPTFLWTPVGGAESVDLVVYRVPPNDEEGPPERVLAVALPGSAHGWTPALGQCLESGRQYAWSVGVDSEWSEASVFEVLAAPSVTEVEEALEVLRRFVAGESESVVPETVASGPRASAGGHNRPGEVLVPEAVGRGGDDATAEVLESAEATAPTPSSTPSLTLDDQIHLGVGSEIFRDGVAFLWTEGSGITAGASLALGTRALESSIGAVNTAVGHTALSSNTTGSRNSAFGEDALFENTVGSSNSAFGEDALKKNVDGMSNSAFGEDALYSNTEGSYNSAFGEAALRENETGTSNSAFGFKALYENTSGSSNSAFGRKALYGNTTGTGNTASGKSALYSNETGASNTAVGNIALNSNETGSENTALGTSALVNNREGSRNTAVGSTALGLTVGSDNIGLGYYAGAFVVGTSHNIMIGNDGSAGGGGTIRIGDENHIKTFVAGIRGVTTGVADATDVLIDSNGQLGTVSSSRRVKEAIENMDSASDRLLRLRPVTFRFRRPFEDGSKPRQFGLIAEEVAEVFPELTVYDEVGRPETVKYHLLSSLLLNELQKQHRRVELLSWLMGAVLVGGVALTVGRWCFG